MAVVDAVNSIYPRWNSIRCPIVGMIHLVPLAGAPRYGGDPRLVQQRAHEDAAALVEGGVHGLMVENFGDTPFQRDAAPAETIAQIAAIAGDIRRQFPDVPLGINVLRNDGPGAMAIAHAVGAQFIRVNIFCGAKLTDQGMIQGNAAEVMRCRARLRAEQISVFADVDVKHSAPLAERMLEDEVSDTLVRGHADALIVSGTATGQPTSVSMLRSVKNVARGAPVWVGSGVCPETVQSLVVEADGLIVGTSLKKDGVPANPVEIQRVRELMGRVNSLA